MTQRCRDMLQRPRVAASAGCQQAGERVLAEAHIVRREIRKDMESECTGRLQ